MVFLDSELYENVRLIMYTASFPPFTLSTMARSLRSRPPSFGAPIKEKAEDLPMSGTSKYSTKRPRNDDPPLDLLPRLFGRMKRGVWFRVLPTEDTLDDICDALHQEWEDLLPLLIDYGLLACNVSDDVKNYTFKINTWEKFQVMHRQTLDMRRTSVR